MLPTTLWSLAVLMLVVTCAAWDLVAARMPDVVTGAGMLLGISLGAAQGWNALLGHSAAMLLAAYLLTLPYHLGSVDDGEVKLAGALGALTGLPDTLVLLLLVALYGGLLGLVGAWLLESPEQGRWRAPLQRWLRKTRQGRLPHGLTMLAAALTLLWLQAPPF
jgi:prepilin peptidase CpaA